MVKKRKIIKLSPSQRTKKRQRQQHRSLSSQQEMFQQAILQHQTGHLQQAEILYRKILHTDPNHFHALQNMGILAHQLRNNEFAVELLRKAVKCRPDFAGAHYNLGVSLYDSGQLTEALTSFRRAISLNPEYAEAYCNQGNILMSEGHMDEAAASYRQAIILKPDYVDAHYNLGTALMAQGNLEETIASFRRALRLRPDFAEAHCNLGITLKELGEIDAAVASFKKALQLNPNFALAYNSLALLIKFTEVDNIILAMQKLYSKEETSDPDRRDLGFALGKAFEDLNLYEKSFEYILEANRLKRLEYNYSIQNDANFIEKIKKIFSPDFFSLHQGLGCQDKSPIFIVGMPRSGTSLVEQVLASHPLVFGAGELEILGSLINTVCKESSAERFPECARDLDETALAKIGSEYITEIRQYSTDAQYITDKMPYNFLRLGLIKIILPRAKIIHCTRDPMDNCYSIFKKDFRGDHGYAFTMEELGQYYTLYRGLMAHWEMLLPDFICSIQYEEMVSGQEAQTKRLLDFCGLPWDNRCLDFYKTKRRVSTASFAQVRRPIYRDSVQLWRHYEKQLEPLKESLYGQV